MFNKVPISLSTFNVGMSSLWYTHILGHAEENFRVGATMGLYGFQFLLPVPKVGVDLYLGQPSQTVQFKAGMSGFYDVAVGGHGGLALEIGTILKNRYDISFMCVPVGSDSKRSYAEFMGLKSEEEANIDYEAADRKWVEMPYFGVFLGLRF